MAQVQGVYERSQRPDTAPDYALYTIVAVSSSMYTISQPNTITKFQVFWCPWDSPELQGYLSPVTMDESHEYRCDVPLIFFHVVKIHLPIRVCG